MSDWYGAARSNYFKVKDKKEFKVFCDNWNVELIDNQNEEVGFLSNDSFGHLPECRYDAHGNEIESGFIEALSKHLMDGQVAICMEAGAEKLRYITGYAIAINNKGQYREINLDDIYKKAEKLGNNLTECTY